MLSRLLSAACLLALVLPPVAGVAAERAEAEAPPSRDAQAGALMTLLRAPHPQVDAFHLKRIGPDINTLLVEFATATHSDLQVRLRSLAWLAYFPSHQSRQVLLETLRARDAVVPAKRVCLRALATAFGAEMLPIERDYLQDRNLFVREAAAYALGDIDDRRVNEILSDHLGREPEFTVRDAALSSLRRIAARNANKQP